MEEARAEVPVLVLGLGFGEGIATDIVDEESEEQSDAELSHEELRFFSVA